MESRFNISEVLYDVAEPQSKLAGNTTTKRNKMRESQNKNRMYHKRTMVLPAIDKLVMLSGGRG